jgi:hypothetical protein
MMHSWPIIILPACTFPPNSQTMSRQKELCANITHIQRHMPNSRIIVVDSGHQPPMLSSSVELVYSPDIYSRNPSIGEVLMLLRGLDGLAPEQRILKLHARCPLSNFSQLKLILSEKQGFVLLSKNLFSWKNPDINKFPYVDTRVFCLRAGVMKTLLEYGLEYLQNSEINFEQAMLPAIYRTPGAIELVLTSGSFFPILKGKSGHGRNYNSPSSLLRSHIKALLFRVGL